MEMRFMAAAAGGAMSFWLCAVAANRHSHSTMSGFTRSAMTAPPLGARVQIRTQSARLMKFASLVLPEIAPTIRTARTI
jgi:hypothetical protein